MRIFKTVLSLCGVILFLCPGSLFAQKVVFVNIRGANQLFVDSLIKAGTLTGNSAFKLFGQEGYKADYLLPVVNAVTAVNNSTMETGVYPNKHGIVGNTFGRQGSPLNTVQSGFDIDFQSETVWEAASRQGKRVIRLGTLQVKGLGKTRYDVPTIAQSAPLSPSQRLQLIPSATTKPITGFKTAKLYSIDGSLRSSSISFSGTALKLNAFFYASEDGDAGKRIIFDDDDNFENGFLANVKEGEWFPVVLEDASPKSGCYAKFFSTSQAPGKLTLYIGPVFRTDGFPKSFVKSIEEAVGFYVGGPDYMGYKEGKLDVSMLKEQIAMETNYLVNVALYCLRNMSFDLLMLDHPALDRYGHYFYSSGNGWENLSVMEPGYVYTDANLNTIASAMDIRTTSLVVASGHGFSFAHTSYSSKELLKKAGLKPVPKNDASLAIVPSKVSAHIYLSRKEDGNAVKSKLETLRDPVTGNSLFHEVMLFSVSSASSKELYHPRHTGDLWISFHPGYTFDGTITNGNLTGIPFFPGEHGYSSRDKSTYGLLYVYPRREEISRVDAVVSSVDVVPIVCQLLSIKSPH